MDADAMMFYRLLSDNGTKEPFLSRYVKANLNRLFSFNLILNCNLNGFGVGY